VSVSSAAAKTLQATSLQERVTHFAIEIRFFFAYTGAIKTLQQSPAIMPPKKILFRKVFPKQLLLIHSHTARTISFALAESFPKEHK
jgi:hypothetical protein